MNVTTSMIITFCITGVISKCGQKIETNINNASTNNILLYPFRISKCSQSYDTKMVAKEIAYRKEYLRSESFDLIGWITFEYCNDLSMLMEILINVLLDELYKESHFVIHLSTEFLINVQPLLHYFNAPSIAFITDNGKTDISVRGGDLMHIYYEESNGFTDIPMDIEVPNILYIINCYSQNDTCQCLPFDEVARTETDSAERNATDHFLYFGDYTDIVQMKETFKDMTELNNKSMLLRLITRMDKNIPDITQLNSEFQEIFNKIDTWTEHNSFAAFSYSVHQLTCSESPFMNGVDIRKECKKLFDVKTLATVTGMKYDLTNTSVIHLKNHTCKPMCPVGQTIHFDKVSFAWKCQPCSHNSVKSTVGNADCMPCLRGWVASTDAVFCIDTYKTLSLKFTDNSSIIMLSVSGVLLSGISSSMFMFIKHNETPIVKSSNVQMSFLQLISQLIIVILMPFLFIGDPNTLICILRPTCIGVLLTISTAVTLSKTRTLLRIFQSEIRLSKHERRSAKLTELFIVILFVLSDISLLLVSFQYRTPNEAFFISDVEKYREKYCNTDKHIMLQFIFVLIILLFNTVLAVKARHLPVNFNETRKIILANILSVVIVGNVLWLSSFQTNYYWKSIFLFYATFLLNGINFIILYGYKIYILLFLPEINTRTYFNNKVRNKIEKQVYRMEMKHIDRKKNVVGVVLDRKL